MEFTNQPSVEELQNDIIYLRYLVRDIRTLGMLKRMSYYTELKSRPGKIYFMQGYRRPIDQESLDSLVKQGQIYKFNQRVILEWEKDVWMDDEGKVYLLTGYAPWEDDKLSNDITQYIDL